MKKEKKLSVVISSLITAVLTCAASFSAGAEVIYKTNADRSQTVITINNPDMILKYDINSSGGGKRTKILTISFLVSAETESCSKLPENVQTADIETIYQPPETEGDFFRFYNGGAVMALKDAQKLAGLLNTAEGISNVQILQEKTTANCWLYENWYTAPDGYEFNINDFAEITEKGFDVSLHEYGYISIIPPGYDANGDIHSANYQGMIAAMEIQQSKGIELMPYIYCQALEHAAYNKFNIPGDLNADFSVNVADLVDLQKIISNKNIAENNIPPESADVNGDGYVNVFDAAFLRRKLLDIQHK